MNRIRAWDLVHSEYDFVKLEWWYFWTLWCYTKLKQWEMISSGLHGLVTIFYDLPTLFFIPFTLKNSPNFGSYYRGVVSANWLLGCVKWMFPLLTIASMTLKCISFHFIVDTYNSTENEGVMMKLGILSAEGCHSTPKITVEVQMWEWVEVKVVTLNNHIHPHNYEHFCT